jgi:superfamily II DNA/RNA helicase
MFSNVLGLFIVIQTLRIPCACCLRQELLFGVLNYGLQHPTAEQVRALPAILSGEDVVLITQMTCTEDKAVTIAIAALSHLHVGECRTQVLIIVPTRESARQVSTRQQLCMYARTHRCIQWFAHCRRVWRSLRMQPSVAPTC